MIIRSALNPNSAHYSYGAASIDNQFRYGLLRTKKYKNNSSSKYNYFDHIVLHCLLKFERPGIVRPIFTFFSQFSK